MKQSILILLFTLLLGSGVGSLLHAQPTGITYQGVLQDHGRPAEGIFDLGFSLHTAYTNGNPVGPFVAVPSQAVSNGLFTVQLDFGPHLFTGQELWLQLEARETGEPNWESIWPRQQLSWAPYAIHAGSVPANGVVGLLDASQISPGAIGGALLADGSVDTFKIDDGTIQAGDINPATFHQTFWHAEGNLGMNPDIHFLGTVDDVPLEMKVHGRRALRLEPTPDVDLAQLMDWETGYSNAVNVILGSSFNAVSPGVQGASVGGGGGSSWWKRRDPFFERDEIISFIHSNVVSSDMSTIAGGFGNRVETNAVSATIGGGEGNTVEAWHGAVAGGGLNVIHSESSGGTIAGGFDNILMRNSPGSTIGGGSNNRISSNLVAVTVAGGHANRVSGSGGVIGGGGILFHEVRPESTSTGFYANQVDGTGGSVPGGAANLAGGDFSLAAGLGARANHPGSFVWADSSQSTNIFLSSNEAFFNSIRDYEFAIRAVGGVRLSRDTSLYFDNQTRQMINLFNATYGIGVQDFTMYMRSNSDFSWFRGGTHADEAHNPGAGGIELMRLTSIGHLYLSGEIFANSILTTSDRHAKQDFEPVSGTEVLDRVTALPIKTWRFKKDPNSLHMGPMAQDFHAAFGLGPDDRHIATVDADGVALAAIQGLNRKLESELKARDETIRGLQDRLATLEQQVSTLLGKGQDQ